jgi:hypothetical protein
MVFEFNGVNLFAETQVWGSISGRVSGLSIISKAQHLRFRARHVSGVTPPPAIGSKTRSFCFEK